MTANEIYDDWDANENTNQVDDQIVDALLDNSNQKEQTAEEEGKFQIIDYSEALENASMKKKATLPIMTKYERAKIIGYRATQIAKGAIPLVNTSDLKDPFDKAERELAEKKTPFIIRRTLPDNTYEDWKMEEFLF